MISAFRRSLDTWPVRGFFLIMVAAFIVWGIGDVFRLVGTSTWVAKVGEQTIEGPVFQAEYQRDLNQATRSLPSGQDASPGLKRSVGDAALQRLIGQAALDQELRRLRVVTPDAAVRDATYAMPAFRDKDGKFSRQVFEAVLRNKGLTEQRLVEMVRADLAQRQLLEAVAAGAVAPQAEAVPLYQEQFEKRSADMVEFPFAAETAPAPAEADLQRWYDNHPDLYSTPELRRIKAIVLSPQTLAKDIPITDDELHAAYEQRKAEYVTPEKRSAAGGLGPRRGQGAGAGGAMAWRRRLGGDAGRGTAGRGVGGGARRRHAAGIPRRRPGQGGVRGAGGYGVRSGEGRRSAGMC